MRRAVVLLALVLSACAQPVPGTPVAQTITAAPFSADPSAPPLQPTSAPHPDGRGIAVPFTAACTLFTAVDMERLIDAGKPVTTEEKPRQARGAVTNRCVYSQSAEGSFGGTSIIFYPAEGHRLDVGMRGVLANKTTVRRLDRDGDLIASYHHTTGPTKRGLVVLRKIGPDGIMFLLDVDSQIPDVVTSRLPAVADTILSRLPPRS